MTVRYIQSFFAAVFLLVTVTACGDRPEDSAPVSSPLSVMSFNIRYNTPNDSLNAWPYRKDHVADVIGRKYQVDIAGLQEALKGQVDDLQERLPEYAWFGVGRDDGAKAGEFTPIFYRKDRLELLEGDTFWLSETPDVPGSKSWDAAITRIVTWGRFKEIESGREFYFFNTHFDHRGEASRVESAKILAARLAELPEGVPFVITGDFNTREESEAYDILTSSPTIRDARYVSEAGHEGPTASTTNWKELRNTPESRIDYIFARDGVRVLTHRIIDDRYDGRFPSDHTPVLASIALP